MLVPGAFAMLLAGLGFIGLLGSSGGVIAGDCKRGELGLGGQGCRGSAFGLTRPTMLFLNQGQVCCSLPVYRLRVCGAQVRAAGKVARNGPFGLCVRSTLVA